MNNQRFISDLVDDVTDSVSSAAKWASNKAKSFYDDFTSDNNITSPAHPDLSKFTKAVNAEDLSRSNLFLVRFDNFLAKVDGNNLTLSFEDKLNESDNSGFSFFNNYTANKIKDAGAEYLMNTDLGQKVMGAYSPKLINMIPGGSVITGAIGSSFDVNKDFAMLVKAVSISGSSFDTSHLFHDRKPMTLVTGRTTDTITMTFYLRTNHIERQVIEKWMQIVHDPNSNSFGFYDDYARKIDIFPLDRRGVPHSVVQCSGCFPTKISNVQYDVDSNNSIATFDVEFAVSTYKTASFDGSTPVIDSVGAFAENVLSNPLAQSLLH